MIRNGILLEFQEEPEGGYTVTVPALPGCVSYGETFERAVEMIKDAMEGWLAVAREEQVSIPEPFQAVAIASL
ncbi:MAG: type II toxin-antitoxin system HicB family antitoxin [Dehalococcoidia bacterium]